MIMDVVELVSFWGRDLQVLKSEFRTAPFNDHRVRSLTKSKIQAERDQFRRTKDFKMVKLLRKNGTYMLGCKDRYTRASQTHKKKRSNVSQKHLHVNRTGGRELPANLNGVGGACV